MATLGRRPAGLARAQPLACRIVSPTRRPTSTRADARHERLRTGDPRERARRTRAHERVPGSPDGRWRVRGRPPVAARGRRRIAARLGRGPATRAIRPKTTLPSARREHSRRASLACPRRSAGAIAASRMDPRTAKPPSSPAISHLASGSGEVHSRLSLSTFLRLPLHQPDFHLLDVSIQVVSRLVAPCSSARSGWRAGCGGSSWPV
jgi:hypothetical protein